MLKYMQDLCEEFVRLWGEQDHSPQRFAELARNSLLKARLHERFDQEALVRFCFDHGSKPAQIDNAMQYGQPPITVFNDGRVALDIYFFVSPEGPIHDHGFAGAFTNLVGRSLHSTYKYTCDAATSPKLYRGTLSHDTAELLMPGDVREIHPATTPGSSFIHRVWHLDRPTVVAVLRLIRNLKGAETYDYYENGIAVRGLNWDVPFFGKRTQMLSYLYQTSGCSADRLADELFLGDEPWLSFHYLFPYYSLLLKMFGADTAWPRLMDLIENITKKHSPFVGPADELLRIFDRVHAIDWTRLFKMEHRLLAALLRTFSDRAAIDAWITRLHPQHDPSAALTRWLGEMVEQGSLNLQISAEHLAALGPLIQDPRRETPSEVERELLETDLFAPLFRRG